MSDEPRPYLRIWSAPVLFITALGTSGMLLLAVLGANFLSGGILAVLFVAVGVYIAAPRAAGDSVMPASADENSLQIPSTARALAESLNDPILILDLSSRLVLANRASHAIVGADVENKHISSVLRTPEILEAIERVLAGGAPETVAFNFLVPVERHFEAFIARAGGGGADATFAVVQLRDLTAMRRNEEMRADFIANVSHELRTPLAAVIGFIDTLRGHARDDAAAREQFLEIMSIETGRMRRLIDDLLSLTRIELNEHNPPSGTVDLTVIVRDVAAALTPLAEAEGITFQIAAAERLPAMGDRDELIQVFQNLLHNAIKYGRERSAIRVSFGRSPSAKYGVPGQVFAAVQDESDGIAREAIPRLTERFYRVSVKRSRERGGTGLGLAIVKHILNRHHGRLQIESTLGVGSTFTVYLPAVAVEEKSAA